MPIIIGMGIKYLQFIKYFVKRSFRFIFKSINQSITYFGNKPKSLDIKATSLTFLSYIHNFFSYKSNFEHFIF